MGLDMYLNKNFYIGANYEDNKISGEINITKDGKLIPVKLNRIAEINEMVGYWRKANQIHKWFVDNIQEGVDDCGTYNVGIEDLKKLKSDCQKALQNKKDAAKILPTQRGFFFGGTDIDDYYFQELEETIEICDLCISEYEVEKDFYPSPSFTYHSSW